MKITLSRTRYERQVQIKRDHNDDVQSVVRWIVNSKRQLGGLCAVICCQNWPIDWFVEPSSKRHLSDTVFENPSMNEKFMSKSPRIHTIHLGGVIRSNRARRSLLVPHENC